MLTLRSWLRLGGVLGLVSSGAHAQPVRRVAVDQPFPAWRAVRVATISEAALDATAITALSVGPRGTIVAVDAGAMSVLVFDSIGANRRSIGRRGAGPGEFRHLSAVGWLGDTLAVLDKLQRRISMFTAASGALAGTALWPTDSTFGRPDSLLTAGSSLYAVTIRHTGARVAVMSGRGTMPPPPSRHFAIVSSGAVPTTTARFSDSTQGATGSDCVDGRGVIHILGPQVRDHGALRAMTPAGQLVTAVRDSFALLVHDADPARGTTLLTRSVQPAPMTDAVWDSVAAKYVNVTQTAGSVTCTPPIRRPATIPVIRALAADETGRIWIEVFEQAGAMMYVLHADGTPVGRFGMPRRDANIPWAVRGNRLIVAVPDPDGLHAIHVYRVGS